MVGVGVGSGVGVGTGVGTGVGAGVGALVGVGFGFGVLGGVGAGVADRPRGSVGCAVGCSAAGIVTGSVGGSVPSAGADCSVPDGGEDGWADTVAPDEGEALPFAVKVVGVVVGGSAPSTPRVGRKLPPSVSVRIDTETTKIAAASDGRRPGRPSPTPIAARRGFATAMGTTKA